ncbi:hypothetical protein [Arthrobacter sp. NPDC092385]|uniref:hypothetical protein n=1 Tax=Arthrobacter sp. NPDC092385 TaxID=3363943 RepID=UPI003812BE1F
MSSSNSRPSLLPDVVSGAGIALWYSLPDYAASRRTRAVVKAGVIAASAAYGAYVLRGGQSSADGGSPVLPEPASEKSGPGEPASEKSGPGCPGSRPERTKPGRPALIALAVVLLGSTAAVTIYMERFVYRFGEKLSSRGVRLAHTRIGVALAVLSTLASVAGDALRDRRADTAPRRAA